ncbi:MAG: hypothetical protein PsegKO_34260 [Pseudohongiellaceae bacterium]
MQSIANAGRDARTSRTFRKVFSPFAVSTVNPARIRHVRTPLVPQEFYDDKQYLPDYPLQQLAENRRYRPVAADPAGL